MARGGGPESVTAEQEGQGPAGRIAYLSLMREIEDFLFLEADLLDEREFEAWLDLIADDIRYHMPMRKNLAYRDRALDITAEGDIAWFDDDKEMLVKRVEQIRTEVHWAEEPLSRVSRLVSNIRLADPAADPGAAELRVKSHFLVHRNRLEHESDYLAGRRVDVLRRAGGVFKIARRTIIIDQSVLLAKNLTFFL
jgi:3-phenylpropionate/cinnamic acid dioxygenase small subunit